MVSKDSTDPGLFTHVLLFLTGVGIGGVFVYLGVSAHLNGEPLTSPPVVMVFAIGTATVAVGLYALLNLLTGAPAVPEEAPWTVRPEWQTNRLTSKTSSEGVSPFFATAWNLLTWPLAGLMLYEAIWTATDPDWSALLVLLLPAVGLGFGWVGLKKSIRRWTFGTSTLRMNTMPARVGGRLEARLRAPISFEERPQGGFEVHLSCFRRYEEGAAESRTTGRRLLWRDEKRLQGQPSPEGDGQVEVPISFEVPPDKPPSTPRKTTERILWEIGASAEREGLDYKVSFEIPVFEPNAAPSSTSKAARPETAAEKTEASPSQSPSPAAADLREDLTEPVSRGIRLKEGPGDKLTVSFAPGRAKEITLPIAATSLLCLVVGIYLLALPHLVGVICLFFGVVFGYGGWLAGTRASTITVEEGRIEVTRGPLGRKTTEQMRCKALSDVRVEAETELLGTAYYSLLLESERDDARDRDRGRPSGTRSDDESALAAFANELRKAAQRRRITVAEWLHPKQEADWIAARIRQAAREEATGPEPDTFA